jgi:opacity protein-like surface antigen
MHYGLIGVVALLLCLPARAEAQSFGLGGRLGSIRSDVSSGAPGARFMGGHIRTRLSPRSALELGLDLRTTTSETLTERVREYPLQASLLLFPARANVAPYLLGGAGWYTRETQRLEDADWVTAESDRRFGWHGGFGAELRLGRHAAAHADYRYTLLRLRDEAGAAERSGFGRLLPSYQGSMWTAGLTVYF